MKLQKLPMAVRDGIHLRSWFGRLVIHEATVEIISCSAVGIAKAAVSHGNFRYDSPSLWWPFAIADPNHNDNLMFNALRGSKTQ